MLKSQPRSTGNPREQNMKLSNNDTGSHYTCSSVAGWCGCNIQNFQPSLEQKKKGNKKDELERMKKKQPMTDEYF